MSEVKAKRGRPRKPVPVDEIASLEAIVAFYEKRLDQALETLGEAIQRREQRVKTIKGWGK